MIPEKEGTCLPGNCPIDSSLLVDSFPVTPWKKIEQGHCVPYASTVEHINELKGRLEINF